MNLVMGCTSNGTLTISCIIVCPQGTKTPAGFGERPRKLNGLSQVPSSLCPPLDPSIHSWDPWQASWLRRCQDLFDVQSEACRTHRTVPKMTPWQQFVCFRRWQSSIWRGEGRTHSGSPQRKHPSHLGQYWNLEKEEEEPEKCSGTWIKSLRRFQPFESSLTLVFPLLFCSFCLRHRPWQ